MQIFFGNGGRIGISVRKGSDFGRIDVFRLVGRRVLFRNDYGDMHGGGRHNGNGNAGGFDRQDFGYGSTFIKVRNLFADIRKEIDIKLLIQEVADFQNVAGKDFAVFLNLFFQRPHDLPP